MYIVNWLRLNSQRSLRQLFNSSTSHRHPHRPSFSPSPRLLISSSSPFLSPFSPFSSPPVTPPGLLHLPYLPLSPTFLHLPSRSLIGTLPTIQAWPTSSLLGLQRIRWSRKAAIDVHCLFLVTESDLARAVISPPFTPCDRVTSANHLHLHPNRQTTSPDSFLLRSITDKNGGYRSSPDRSRRG